jgi:hypothetical protein
MKTLIDVNRYLWGKVKNYATVKSISLNSAVEDLLTEGLRNRGYIGSQKEEKDIVI